MRKLGLLVAAMVLPAGLWAGDLKPLNVKHVLWGYCLVGSRPDPKAPGGYSPSDNHPKKLAGRDVGIEGKLSLVAVPNEALPYGNTAQGFALLLVNRTKSEVWFPAADSQLAIIREALDAEGKWRPVECLPRTLCGNSYHRVFLPRNSYWQFAAPVYSGTHKTKMRFVLQGEKPIYSNEFKGSINPEQFSQSQNIRGAEARLDTSRDLP
jgi:hypothetical protein